MKCCCLRCYCCILFNMKKGWNLILWALKCRCCCYCMLLLLLHREKLLLHFQNCEKLPDYGWNLILWWHVLGVLLLLLLHGFKAGEWFEFDFALWKTCCCLCCFCMLFFLHVAKAEGVVAWRLVVVACCWRKVALSELWNVDFVFVNACCCCFCILLLHIVKAQERLILLHEMLLVADNWQQKRIKAYY